MTQSNQEIAQKIHNCLVPEYPPYSIEKIMRCEEPGWIELAVPDGRRGVWMRVSRGAVELCAGREGDDAYIKLDVDSKQLNQVIYILQCLAFSYETA